ncbi:ATP-binding protein [Breoghania corrubedonensis]|uniref:ATP-binding protein n=1 Tax=Breoghania corrubedonensis TaxID=665038 RepID=UPI001475A831|nr:ATP-binding protein [Breoghania corrubedonensis]
MVALDRTLFVASTETRGEIGNIGVALLTDEDAGSKVDDALHRVDNIYRLVYQGIEKRDFGGKADDLARLSRSYAQQAALADIPRDQATLPHSQRDVGKIESWRQAIYGMSRAYVMTSVHVGTDLIALNPRLGQLVAIREMSFAVRDRYSRQCSAFRRSVERDIRLRTAERDAWQQDIGAYRELWRRMEVTASHLPEYPQLQEAVRLGQTKTAETQRMMSSVLNGLSGTGKRGADPAIWASHCFDVYGSIIGIGHIALDLARKDAEAEQTRVLAYGSLWTLALILSIVFSYLTSRFLRRRFSQPMATITSSIKRLEGGDYQTPIPVSRYEDEPGAIGATLESLRAKVQKAERLRRHLDQLRDDLVDHARESNKAKSLFLATISHEIRTPLNGILGTVQLLGGSPLNSDQRRWIEALEMSGDLLRNLVTDVLDYSRIEAGKFVLARMPFNLRDQVAVVEAAITTSAQQKGLSYTSRIAPDVPDHLIGDPAKIGQILLNLVGNAVKFTESGSVSLTVDLDPAHRDSHVTWIRFVVADTGIGIPTERRDILFDPFTQADGSISRRFGGSGLGLAICKGLLQMMAGRIEFECPETGGTTFVVRIPFEIAGSHGEDEKERKQIRAVSRLSVLVAEDNRVNAMIAEEFLRRSGHGVTVVGDGISAVEAAAREDFDVVLMDLSMPRIDGIEATRRIRALDHETRRMVPVIALTADLTAEQRLGNEIDLFDGFLGKPYLRQELNVAIARAIGLLAHEETTAASEEEENILLQHARDLGVDWAHKIVELYITETPHVAEGLNLALRKGDLQAIADIAHRMAGGAEHVGARTIAKHARDAERAADSGDAEVALRAAATLLRVLDDELKRFATQADSELEGTKGTARPA